MTAGSTTKEVAEVTTNKSYGTWGVVVEHADGRTVNENVIDALADAHAVGIDTEATIADYRAAVNAALPAGVMLCGDEFYGPADPADQDFDGFDLDEHGRLDINAIICAIDLYEIAERHDHYEASQ